MAQPAVGARVRIIKDYATVRYIGAVEKQEGIWVGVEWDNATRGKHDGTTGGVKYFECQSGSTAGSFVRIEKVHFGVALLTAILARYLNLTAEHGENADADQLYVRTAGKRRLRVEMVGEEKIQQQQSQIHLLTSARLRGLDIAVVGDGEALQNRVPLLTDLDVSANLITDWDFVSQLCAALPKLQALMLTENRITIPAAVPPAQLPLRQLVLYKCGVSWQQFLVVEPSLPRLVELHLGGNNIASLEDDTQQQQQQQQQADGGGEAATSGQAAARFAALEGLNLEENALSSWEEVLRLQHLPRLKRLHLSDNPLPYITYPGPPPPPQQQQQPAPAPEAAAAAQPAAAEAEAEAAAGAAVGSTAPGALAAAPASASAAAGEQDSGAAGAAAAAPFATLYALYAGGCGFTSWSSVNELNRFPALRELRLTGNPVLGTAKAGGRFEVIGRVASLTLLNGASVRPRERRDSELRYLQHIAAELEAAGTDQEKRAAVRAAHPRVRYLMETYGEVLASAAKSSTAGGSLAANMVELKLTCVAAAAHAKMGTQVKKLPRSTVISSVRLLCEKLFKVKADQQALFLRVPGEPVPEEIGEDEDDRPISYFAVQDGYEFLIDEIDTEAKRKAGEEARKAGVAAHETRMADQLKAGDGLQQEFARSMGLSGAPPPQ